MDIQLRAILSSATFLHSSTRGCASVNDRSCSERNAHTLIFDSQTRSVIDAGTSDVVVAPGKRVVCWTARTAALWPGSDSCLRSTFLPLDADLSFLEQRVQKLGLSLSTSYTNC